MTEAILNEDINELQTEQVFATTPKLFGVYEYENVEVAEKVLENYIAVDTARSRVFVPHTAGRYQQKQFKKASCPIIERVVGAIGFAGRNTGKKLSSIKIMRNVLEIINHVTGENPIQLVIRAIGHCGPREDSTRVGRGGAAKRQAVDVSSFRRINVGIFAICLAARKKSMRTIKSYAECLADEFIAASNADSASGAVKKREEIEKNAKANR